MTDDDDSTLVDLARQLGLALHNVRLDSALQRSLAQLEERNRELQASRLRIVSASDESRRAIERNPARRRPAASGARAVKLGLAEQLLADPQVAGGLLRELRSDVQVTIGEVRELAYGIYPPMLRDRGLADALAVAAHRSPLACTVEVDLPSRYPSGGRDRRLPLLPRGQAERRQARRTGAKLHVRVRLDGTGTLLELQVADDGAGFGPATVPGQGFVNMADRLGALGGSVDVASRPGAGTTVTGTIPVSARSRRDGAAR